MSSVLSSSTVYTHGVIGVFRFSSCCCHVPRGIQWSHHGNGRLYSQQRIMNSIGRGFEAYTSNTIPVISLHALRGNSGKFVFIVIRAHWLSIDFKFPRHGPKTAPFNYCNNLSTVTNVYNLFQMQWRKFATGQFTDSPPNTVCETALLCWTIFPVWYSEYTFRCQQKTCLFEKY